MELLNPIHAGCEGGGSPLQQRKPLGDIEGSQCEADCWGGPDTTPTKWLMQAKF